MSNKTYGIWNKIKTTRPDHNLPLLFSVRFEGFEKPESLTGVFYHGQEPEDDVVVIDSLEGSFYRKEKFTNKGTTITHYTYLPEDPQE